MASQQENLQKALTIFMVFGLLSQMILPGLSRPTRPTLPIACLNTISKPGSNVTLMHIKVDGRERQCCGCNPSFRMESPCQPEAYDTTVCVPCERNTHMDKYAHNETQCIPDVTPASTKVGDPTIKPATIPPGYVPWWYVLLGILSTFFLMIVLQLRCRKLPKKRNVDAEEQQF